MRRRKREVTGFDKRRDRAAEAKTRLRGAVLRSRSVRRQDQTRFKREREIEKERDWRCELRTRRRELDYAISSLCLGLGRDLAAASGVGPVLSLPTLSSFSLSLPFCCICESFFLSLFLPLHVCELLSLHVSVPEVI